MATFMDFLAADTKYQHAVAESTLLGATRGYGHIYNVKAIADTDNGKLVNIDDMAYAENQYYTQVEPTTGSRVGLVLTTPEGYDEIPSYATEEKYFYNALGSIMRVYELNVRDRFTVSQSAITVLNKAPVKNNYVIAKGYDLTESATAPDANGFVGKIVEVISRTDGNFYKIEVIRNQTIAGGE